MHLHIFCIWLQTGMGELWIRIEKEEGCEWGEDKEECERKLPVGTVMSKKRLNGKYSDCSYRLQLNVVGVYKDCSAYGTIEL